jgi:hypothetical protein
MPTAAIINVHTVNAASNNAANTINNTVVRSPPSAHNTVNSAPKNAQTQQRE